MPRSKDKKKKTHQSESQKLAWAVIISYLALLIAIVFVHPNVAIVKWEPLDEFTQNSERWLILVAASVVLFSLMLKPNQEQEQFQVRDSGILVGAAATFLAAFLAFENISAAEGILLLVLAYPIIMAGSNYLPKPLYVKVPVTFIAVLSAFLLLSSILPGVIEVLEALLFIAYLAIAPVVIVLWLWIIAIVNGRQGR